MTTKTTRRLAEELYYMRTGLDFTKKDHENNIQRCIELLNNWKSDLCKKQRVDEKTKDAIRFILDNPDLNEYISDNIEHFMTAGDPDDNSIPLANEWEEQ